MTTKRHRPRPASATPPASPPPAWPGALVGAALGGVVGALSLLVPVDPTPIGSGLSPASMTATAPAGPPVTASASTAAAPAEAETEADYLARATGQIQSAPAEALALAEGHAARFPEGKLGQEREMIAISALAALGRKGEARARANLFLTLFPESAHKPRLEELISGLAEKKPPP